MRIALNPGWPCYTWFIRKKLWLSEKKYKNNIVYVCLRIIFIGVALAGLQLITVK
jgi:hypothetical protein